MENNEAKNGDLEHEKVSIVQNDGFLEIIINSPTFLREQAKNFQAAADAAIEKECTKFMINFNNCQYISSEGLGCIAEFWRKCNENKGFVMVVMFNQEPANELLNFFEIIGLARVMKDHIFTQRDKAEHFLNSH